MEATGVRGWGWAGDQYGERLEPGAPPAYSQRRQHLQAEEGRAWLREVGENPLGPRVPLPRGGEAGGRGRGPPRDHGTAPEAGLGQARGGEPAAPPAVDLVSVPLGLQEGERV